MNATVKRVRNSSAWARPISPAAADQEGTNKARPGRIRYRVGVLQPGIIQYLLNKGQEHANMVPGGDFRYHTAIDRVQVDLAVQTMRNKAPISAIQRHTGLVTAGFDAENDHRRRIIHRSLCKPSNPALSYAAGSRPCAGFIYVWTEYLNNAKRSRKRERVF